MNRYILFGKNLAFLLHLKIYLLNDPETLSQDKYPRETSAQVFQCTGARMSLAAKGKQPDCPSAQG